MLYVKRIRPSAVLPNFATIGSAGADISASLEDKSKPIVIKSGDRALIKTGLKFEFSDGFEIQIRPRSGLALKNGVTVLNAPGTIDSDYRGEIGVILINHSKEDFVVNDGDRIAQIVFAEVSKTSVKEIHEELSETDRGVGGFGSTGIHNLKI